MADLLRTAWFPILVLSLCPGRASGATNHFTEFAQSCGVAAVVASARVFSENNENRWKEYSAAQQA